MSKESILGTLVIVVLKARNLIDNHTFYKQDPYAKVELSGVTKKTEIDAKGGQHPVWDAELRFPISGDATKKNRTLNISCFSEERKDDELLGEGTLDITETLKSGEFDDWIPLHLNGAQRGDIYLEMTFFAAGPAPLQRRASKFTPNERLARPQPPFSKNPPNTPPKSNATLAPPHTSPGAQYDAPRQFRPQQQQQQQLPGPGRQSHLSPPSNSHSRSPKGPDAVLPPLPQEAPKQEYVPNILRPGPQRGLQPVQETRPVPVEAAMHARYPGTGPSSLPLDNTRLSPFSGQETPRPHGQYVQEYQSPIPPAQSLPPLHTQQRPPSVAQYDAPVEPAYQQPPLLKFSTFHAAPAPHNAPPQRPADNGFQQRTQSQGYPSSSSYPQQSAPPAGYTAPPSLLPPNPSTQRPVENGHHRHTQSQPYQHPQPPAPYSHLPPAAPGYIPPPSPINQNTTSPRPYENGYHQRTQSFAPPPPAAYSHPASPPVNYASPPPDPLYPPANAGPPAAYAAPYTSSYPAYNDAPSTVSFPFPHAPVYGGYPPSQPQPPRNLEADLPDPYLIQRYKTPLPLPPGSDTPRPPPKSSHTPAPAPPSVPKESRDEVAAREMQRREEEEDRRRREQEQRDEELARNLDLELNLEGEMGGRSVPGGW